MSPFSILLKLRMIEVVSGDNWSYKTCKAPVKSSPKDQHPAFHRPDALSVTQPTQHWKKWVYSMRKMYKSANKNREKVSIITFRQSFSPLIARISQELVAKRICSNPATAITIQHIRWDFPETSVRLWLDVFINASVNLYRCQRESYKGLSGKNT